MRYLAILKGSPESEAYVPTKESAAQMATYIEQGVKDGWLIATEGLHPSAKATRLTLAGGKRSIVDGPFTETKELIASYAMLQVGSKEEAIERTETFLNLIGGGEIELWQVYEPADFA